MTNQFLCKTFISSLLIGCMVNALQIRSSQPLCIFGYCTHYCWYYSGPPKQDFLNYKVKSSDCNYIRGKDQYLSWEYLPVTLPVPNGNVEICIRNTNACLGIDYSLDYSVYRVVIELVLRERDVQKYGLLQQWHYDGKTFRNARLGQTACVTSDSNNFILSMKPCEPNNPFQSFQILA